MDTKVLCFVALAGAVAGGGYAGEAQAVVVEVARGESWVSPYWGYNTPKIVCDGKAYYTAGLWGMNPAEAEGVLYKCEEARWREGAHLPGIYQPATLVLDAQGRLVIAYTRKGRPARFLRSKTPGNIAEFDELPAPPDMSNAYYIGVAIRAETLFLAYLVDPAYTMYLTSLDLGALRWSPSVVLCEGQVQQKPKTAWTYPILAPTEKGLHFVASNSPDGGEGNTYNQVWYLFFPSAASQPTVRELVADCPVGYTAYAMDMLVDAADTVHVALLWNHRVYGEPLPPDAPPEGAYHARRDPKSGQWHRSRLAPFSYTGFFEDRDGLLALTAQRGTVVPLQWTGADQSWRELPALCDVARIPAGPSFIDVLSRYSGSDLSRGLALVSDGLLPKDLTGRSQRVVWALLPPHANSPK